MPAISADTVALPRILEPGLEALERQVISVTTAPSGFEGEGFPVRRAFAGVDLRALDPFVHMDQMGEVDYAPGEPKGTPWHPHRGFETVTYMIDGILRHQDSNGGGGLITDDDTQWMQEQDCHCVSANHEADWHRCSQLGKEPVAENWVPPTCGAWRADHTGMPSRCWASWIAMSMIMSSWPPT
jgi:Pirin